jgi:hypothetical protein
MRKYLSCLAALLVIGCAANPQPAMPAARIGGPLPLDPITPAEQAQARKLAESDERTRELLDSDPCPVYVISIAPKLTPSDNEPRGRHADLLYVGRGEQYGVRVLVDLEAGRVVSLERVPASSVPIGTCDTQRALEIARGSEELRVLLRADLGEFRVLTGPLTRETAQSSYVQALRSRGAGPDDPCTRNRCVFLVFNSGGRMVLRDNEVLVDLTSRQVRVTRTGGER